MSQHRFNSSVTVVGAGSFGTALAALIANNGHPVNLWSRNSDQAALMQQERTNASYLPGFRLPESISVTANLTAAIAGCDHIIIAVPSAGFSDVLHQLKPIISNRVGIVCATKGLEPSTGRLLSEMVRGRFPINPFAVLSGPTFAKELAAGLPTAITLASSDVEYAKFFAQLVHSKHHFRVYISSDVIGVQLGGAVKNVIAIGAGLSDGLGFGANARTALITRGVNEVARLGQVMGADAATFMGMAGLGDLVLTCTDNQSRNRRFGLAIGQGKSVDQSVSEIGQVVEGYRNTEEVYLLAARLGVEMPICNEIFRILYEGKPVTDAAAELLGRDLKNEG